MGVLDHRKFFNARLGLACSLIALSSFNYGFDNQAFASTQAMDPFAKQFGVLNSKTGLYALEAWWLSLFNSLNYIGFGAGMNIHFLNEPPFGIPADTINSGVIIGSLVSARFGRRWCMFSMSLYALVTATICVTSNTREQIMAARILNYVYVGMELAVVPTYQSEIGTSMP
jgi:SP family sugar:H+ symporter-like MFS transporter